MDKGGRHEKKSDGDSEESDEQRKKSPESRILPFFFYSDTAIFKVIKKKT